MEPIEYKWLKAEDADIPVGEICIGLYRSGIFSLPLMVIALGNGRYEKFMTHDVIEVSPDWILQMPPVGDGGVVTNYPRDEAD
jgi:hypothetical protein